MPHYSIPVIKSILCWAEVEHDGNLKDAVDEVVKQIRDGRGWMLDIEEGMDEECLEYEPDGLHYCDEQEVSL